MTTGSLASQGFEIGNHTHTRLDLAPADVATVRAELQRSQAKLREELGQPAPLFAYPFGVARTFLSAPASWCGKRDSTVVQRAMAGSILQRWIPIASIASE